MTKAAVCGKQRKNNRGASAPLLLCLALLLVQLAGAPPAALALGSRGVQYNAAFKTVTLWDDQDNLPVEVGIWYPTKRAESTVYLQDWTLRAAVNARHIDGLYPLIVISHDAGGGMLSYHDTAASLARHGFVVAAPTHSLDNFLNSGGMFKPGQILDRPLELSFVLNSILGADNLDFIDHRRIGVLGVGVGAATVLTLAGAQPDFGSYWSYCTGQGQSDPYCSPLAQGLMGAPMQRSHNHPDLPRRKITSIALAAPAYGMFFTRQGLTGVTQPCLIFAPGSDYGNRAARHAESIKSNLPVLPVMLYLPGHDTIDLAAPCSENLLDFDGLSCLPPDEDTLKSRFKNFNQPLITFFKATLGDPHPPRPKVNH